MKSSYWNETIYKFFLNSLSSCTYVSYTDKELQDELDVLAMRAIARFKFPQVPLTYDYDPQPIEGEEVAKGYYFTNSGVGPREWDVIVAWMKVLWVEYQLSKERNYENLYADKDVKAFSSGNLISSIEKSFTTIMDAARKIEENYYRVAIDGSPSIGEVNV